ncbi:MAG: ABC transporter ATP-binding protein [Magnetococcales bacterium]|nr:ABC transporter ATP-binding protein [Magnetococcales bacterium]
MPAHLTTDTEETAFGALNRHILRRFLGLTRPYLTWIVLAILLFFPVISAQLAQPLLIRRAVDHHLATGDMAGFNWLLAEFFGLIVLQLVGSYGQALVNNLLGQRVVRDLRQNLFAHLLRMDAAFFSNHATGRLTNRLTNDTEVVSQMVSAGMINLLGDALLLAGIAVSMILLSPRLSLVALCTLPIIILGTLHVARRLRVALRDGRLIQSRMAGTIAEEIDGHQVIHLFQRQQHNQNVFDGHNTDYLRSALRSNFLEALQFAFVDAMATITIALLFWYGGFMQGSTHEVSMGTLMAFIDYLRRIFFPIRDLSTKFTTLQAAMTALERIFDLLDTQPSIVDPKVNPVQPSSRQGGIRYRDVYLDYGRKMILHGIDLELRPGEKIALVGPTGAGKSSLARLLNRTWDPTRGEVEIDGVNVRQIPLDQLRRMVGVVHQETFLFAGTFLDNITLHDPTITLERAHEAARQTGILECCRDLPQGLHTPIAERGSNLSAGQRQLLGIARVLVVNPRILILDEATSSVDTISERFLQEAMHRLMANRTAMVIAHRLNTILHMDRIVVIAGGRIVESGTHDNLLAQGGMYARLHALQFQVVPDIDLIA